MAHHRTQVQNDLTVHDAQRLWREENEQLKQGHKWLQVKTVSTDEFQVIKQLGRGFYGPETLVKEKNTGNLYAMKSIERRYGPEDWMVIDSIKKERQVLMEVNSVWVQRMFHSFLDPHRYIELLEYVPRGSLADLLQQEGNLLEYQSKFYGAEMLMAINVVHRYGFMHRNIQPSNFLIDQFGHIKLADFGCCLRFLPLETCQKMATEASIIDGKPYMSDERRGRINIYQRKTTDNRNVGRTTFLAPEVVRPRPKGFLAQIKPAPPGIEYTFACDFWSFGVCMYNMLFGQLPFRGKSDEEVISKIIKWRQNLTFPVVQPITDQAKDLMKRLLCDEPYRLGISGCEDVMSHVFFDGTDWMYLRVMPVDVPYTHERRDSSSSVGVPAYILNMLGEGDWASHNDTGGDAGGKGNVAGEGGGGGTAPGGEAESTPGGEGGGAGGVKQGGAQAEIQNAANYGSNVDHMELVETITNPESSCNFRSDDTYVLPACQILSSTNSTKEANEKGRKIRVSTTEAPSLAIRLSKTAIESWIQCSDGADPPPDDLQRTAQDNVTNQENEEMEKSEKKGKEKKTCPCSVM